MDFLGPSFRAISSDLRFRSSYRTIALGDQRPSRLAWSSTSRFSLSMSVWRS